MFRATMCRDAEIGQFRNMSQESHGLTTCVFCGSAEFIWGHTYGADGWKVHFLAEGPFFTFTSKKEPVRVRKCDRCGNLQFFSEK